MPAFLGRRNLADDQLCDLAGQEDIRIAPMVQGAKRGGLFTLVLGAALFFAAPYLVNPATAGLLGEGGAMVFGAGVGSMGKLLMLSGVTQLLSPQQKGLSTADGPDNGPLTTSTGRSTHRPKATPSRCCMAS